MRDTKKPGPANVGLDVDGREQAAESNQVVEIVDVVRIPVVLGAGAHVQVVDADFLYSDLVQPNSWSTLLAETRGQLV